MTTIKASNLSKFVETKLYLIQISKAYVWFTLKSQNSYVRSSDYNQLQTAVEIPLWNAFLHGVALISYLILIFKSYLILLISSLYSAI